MRATLLGATFAAATIVAVAAPVPADAQRRDVWGNAYDAGYHDGARAGGSDARDGRVFEYQRHRDYRAGDRGYDRRDGARDAYTQQYRAGFAAGYRDGFYSGGGRGPRSVAPRPAPWFGMRPGVRPPPAARRGVADDIGYANGFEEGFKRGFDDGRDRDRYDPRRHRRYRDADQGYRREFGPKGVYETNYRRGFERGYDQGYDDGQRRRGWR